MNETPLLRAESLTKCFEKPRGIADLLTARPRRALTALSDVDLTLSRGETVGLVGESGCGKSTLGKCLVGVHRPDAGAVTLAETDRPRPIARRIQMIFQDPYASLNPRLTVGSILSEAVQVHMGSRGAAARDRAVALLADVGLDAAFMDRLPHELSGGQRQRISIARALAVQPEIIVADEPVSALDVSVQAQIINLLKALSAEYGLTLLFISHDLSVVFNLCDRVVVMYLGQVVEERAAETMIAQPLHPYSQALLAAAPTPDPDRARTAAAVRGEPPDPFARFAGCRFAGRCPYAEPRCREEAPMLRPVADPTAPAGGTVAPATRVRCHFAEKIADLKPTNGEQE